MKQTDQPRLAFLDALRGFAILMVIFNHAGSLTNPTGLLGRLAEFGGYGVQLFFVISAFTIFLTYERSVSSEQSPVTNFFIRRLLRIVPVYWFGVALYLIAYGMASRGWLPGPELWHFPVHAALMNSLHPEVQSSVVPGGWSISCEVLFYLTVPLWFRLIRSFKSACVFAAVAMIAGPLSTYVLKRLFADVFSGSDPDMLAYFWYRSLPNQLGCFAAGICLYFAWKERKSLISRLRPAFVNCLWVAGALALVLVAEIFHPKMPAYHHLYAVGFAGLAFALAARPWPVVVNRMTVFVGRISYSAYIVHFLLLKSINDHLALGGGDGAFPALALLGAIGTLPLAWVVHRLVEMPATSAAKRLVGLRERGRGPIQARANVG